MAAGFDRFFRFPYFDHYLELALLEYEAASMARRSGILFVGGGPLPLTPISYAVLELTRERDLYMELTAAISGSGGEELKRARMVEIVSALDPDGYEGGMRILSVDSDAKAHIKAVALLESLGVCPFVEALHADGADLTIPQNIEVVVVAAMAEPKLKILENIASQIGPARQIDIIVRSVENFNLRQLFYQPLDPAVIHGLEQLFPRFRRILSFAPPVGSRLINSFELFRISACSSAAAGALNINHGVTER